jgi:penicillin-binding protein 2
MDPNTGDVLAMATVPSYDPNAFIPSISAKAWTELNKDDTDPLLNRAISSYAPGSTYKIPTALAALRGGVGGRSFNCSGGVTYGTTFMRCWIASKNGAHGSLNLSNAIKVSCNSYFYQSGNAAGIDQIVAVGNMLGLGQKSGLPLSGENPGILPGPEFLAQASPNERWTSGYTANTSIGQGMVLASPLQMAAVTAAVANGGTSYYPRLIDRIVSQDGKVLLQEPSKVRANLITDGGLTTEQMEVIRKGMWKVVNEGGGTAGRARIKGYEVAGKTGTAQNWSVRDGRRVQDNHVWFIAYAPAENPRYAVAVIVQGAKSGGGVAAPIVGKILEDTFALDSGNEPVLAALEPAKGNFNFVDSIDFGRDIPAATSAADDGETSSDAATAAAAAGTAAKPAAPNVREDADDRGKVKNKERKPSGLQKFFNFLTGKDRKEKSKKPAPTR